MRKSLVALMLVGCAVAALGPAIAQAPPAPAAQNPSALSQAVLRPTPCVLQALRFLNSAAAPALMSRLNLTEDQKLKVTSLLAKSEEEIGPKVEAQQTAAREFVGAMAKPETDQAALLAAADRANKAEAVVLAERVKALCDFRAILTDQQKAEFSKFVDLHTRAWRAQTTPGAVPPSTPPPAPPQGTTSTRTAQ